MLWTARAIRSGLAIACAATLVLASANANAQPFSEPPAPGYAAPPPGGYVPPPPPPLGVNRDGWFLGGSVGLGNMTTTTADTADDQDLGIFAVNGHFGAMVTPKMALTVEVGADIHEYDQRDYYRTSLVLGYIGIAAKYWATPKLWLKGGLTKAKSTLTSDGEIWQEAEGAGFIGAVGYEIVQRHTWTVDLQFRITAASYDDDATDSSSTALQVGFNWY